MKNWIALHSQHNKQQSFHQLSLFIGRYTTLIIALFTLITLVSSQTQTSNSIRTQFDGVTRDKYVSYLKLDGTNGATIDLPNSSHMDQDLEYTLMMWFKPMGEEWGKRLQYAFKLKGSIQCYFTASHSVICESFELCDKLEAPTNKILENTWNHLTISGHKDRGSYLSLESNTQQIEYDETEYVILRQVIRDWKACLGNCEGQYGYIGGMREFVYIQQYLTKSTASRIKNHYLHWDLQIVKAYYRFSSQNFGKEEIRHHFAKIDYGNADSVQERDYIANDICFPFLEFGSFVNFNQANMVQTLTLGNNFEQNRRNWEYTMSIWLYTDIDSCTESNPSRADDSCHIFKFENVMMLYQESRNHAKFYFYAFRNYYQGSSNRIFLPQDQWLNIQIKVGQFSGFEIRTYDILGRLIQYDKQDRNMGEQRPGNKISFVQGYRGLIQSFIIFQNHQNLPYSPPDFNQPISDTNCLVYLRFEQDFVEGNEVKGQTERYYRHARLNQSPRFKQVPWEEFGFKSGSNNGLVTDPRQLFDGIACDEQFRTLELSDKSSYVMAYTENVENWMSEVTVEFWFRPGNNIDETDHLLSMYSESEESQFFQIALDNTDKLVCGPFGLESWRDPLVTFDDYTEENRRELIWFHLTCQYTYQEQIVGYLFKDTLDKKYTSSISTIASYVPSGSYKIIAGNTIRLQNGTPRLQMKELRIWPVIRTEQQIRDWRYRQLNPRDFSDNTMLAYLRLSENGYSEYNFANSANSQVPAKVDQFNLEYAINEDIIVCPQQTYFYENYCYLNPVDHLIPAIFPMMDSDELYWNFTANHSSLIEQDYFRDLQVYWKASDPILQHYIENAERTSEFKVPAKALRDEGIYDIQLEITNKAKSFTSRKQIKFIPISCRYYRNEDSDAYSQYNEVDTPKGFNDITFKLELRELNNQCDDITFYNKLNETVKYVFSPVLEEEPELQFTINSDRSIDVTFERNEQLKLPINQDVKILFQFYWTNEDYGELVDTYQQHFQDVMYTIRFSQEQQTVDLKLTLNKDFGLINERIVYNASETRVTGGHDETGTLEYEWICPQRIQDVCNGVTDPVLEISFQQFLNAGGQFSQSYEITVKVTWTRVDGVEETFEKADSFIWYDVQSTDFELIHPDPILVTAEEQVIEIDFIHYDNDDIDNLDITWTIEPELTRDSYFSYSDDKLQLTLLQGALDSMTEYTITITVEDQDNSVATTVKELEFLTQQPPRFGSAVLSPEQGQFNLTEFTIIIEDWQSGNAPIKWRVWTSTSQTGEEKDELITDDWLGEDEEFRFKAESQNPYRVEISDQSQESTFKRVFPQFVEETINIQQMITKMNGEEQSYNQRYGYMGMIVDEIGQGEEEKTEDEEVQENINKLLAEVEKDQVTLDDEKMMSNGDTKTIIRNQMTFIEKLLSYQNLITNTVLNKSISIIENIQKPTPVVQDLLQMGYFTKQMAQSISYIFDFTQMNAEELSGRHLYEIDNYEDIIDINKKVENLVSQLQSHLCSVQQDKQDRREVQVSSFKFYIEKFELDTDKEKSLYEFSNEDDQTRQNVNIQQLMKEVKQQSQRPSSICLITTFYKRNLVPLTQSQRNRLEEYSEKYMTLSITDESGQRENLDNINLNEFTQFYFSVKADTFRNNQTICMSYSEEKWSNEHCETEIIEEKLEVKCECNNKEENQYVTLFTDYTRTQSESLTNNREESLNVEESFTFLGIIMFLLVLAILWPVSGIILDRKDFKQADKKIESKQKVNLINQVAQIDQQPFELWKFKQSQIFSYAIPNKSLFYHLTQQMHPLFGILNKFDFQQDRLVRFSPFFAQVSIFGLVCYIVFGDNYRSDQENRNEIVLDQYDINHIILVSFIGMFALLPIPHLLNLTKANIKVKQTKQHDLSNDNSTQHHKLYSKGENTQEQNIFNNSPVPIIRTNKIQCIQEVDSEKKEIKIVPKCQVLKYSIIIFSFVVTIFTIVAGFTLFSNVPLSNQYCALTSFYIGVFGNLFVLSILRICLNSMMAEMVYDKKSSCLSFLVAQEALEIVKDIKLVREAEKQINQLSKLDDIDRNNFVNDEYLMTSQNPMGINRDDDGEERQEDQIKDTEEEEDEPSITRQEYAMSLTNQSEQLPQDAGKYMSSPRQKIQTKPKTFDYCDKNQLRKSADIYMNNSQTMIDQQKSRYSSVKSEACNENQE